MKAPDKIYLYRESAHDYFDEGWGHNEASDVESVEYIRKDFLLEWAKEKKAELLDDEELTDVAAGINMGMDMLIYKIEKK